MRANTEDCPVEGAIALWRGWGQVGVSVLASAVLLVLLLPVRPVQGETPPAGPASRGRLCGTRALAQDPERYAVPGREALVEWESRRSGKILAPGAAAQSPPPITVGTTLPFVVAGSPFLADGTCQYVGEHIYIFVEDRFWDTNNGTILQSHVDALGELFDRSCPADPERGMYELAVEAFGPPPDVDGYDRIFLFILDIPDSRIVGYFDEAVAGHDVPELRRDVLHVDELYVRRNSYLARGTLAHEFQHLIHWGQDPDEELWVDEGLAGYAEEVVGYPEADSTMVAAFLDRPGMDLVTWWTQPSNYGMTYLFMSFLAERFGPELIHWIVQAPRNGEDGIEAALEAAGTGVDFEEAWSQWVIGNYASDDPRYGYRALKGRRVTVTPVEPWHLPLGPIGSNVPGQWGTRPILFRTPGDLVIDFRGEDRGRFRIWSYAMRPAGAHLDGVSIDAENAGRVSVAGIDSLALIVGRTSRVGPDFDISARVPVPTAIAAQSPTAIPDAGHLAPAFPNPFNHTVQVPFNLNAASHVRLVVYDGLGQRVHRLLTKAMPAGSHTVSWDGRDETGRRVGTGRYQLRMEVWPDTGNPEAKPSSEPSFVSVEAVTLLK